MHRNIAVKYGLEVPQVLMGDSDKQLLANEPDAVVVDKAQKRSLAIDVAIPADSNFRNKEHEKMEKYQGLQKQLEQMWKGKAEVVPV